MSEIIDKLTRIYDAKQNIVSAMLDNGIELDNDIESYPEEIDVKMYTGYKPNRACHVDKYGKWNKPEDWPDIESIPVSGESNTVYYLYANHIRENSFCRLSVSSTGAVNWYIGKVENGNFVEFSQSDINSSSTETSTNTSSASIAYIPTSGTVSNGGSLAIWLSSFSCDYTVLKMESDYHITSVSPASWSSAVTSTNNVQNQANELAAFNTCLMRYGSLKYCVYPLFQCFYLESDNLMNLGALNTSTPVSLSNIYGGCYNLQRFRKTGWNIGSGATNYVSSCSNMFNNCYSLIDMDLDFTGLLTDKATSCVSMFNNCYSLRGPINVTGWDFTKARSVSSMFYNCNSLCGVIGMDTWKNFKPTNISSLFYGCYNLKSIDLGGCITSACTNISSTFNQCYSLKSVNLDDSDFSKVTSCASMFYCCYSLKDLNIKNYIPFTTACTTYQQMFYNCQSLPEISFHDWNFSNATILGLVYACTSAKKIDFSGCTINSAKTQADSSASYAIVYSVLDLLEYLDLSSIDYGKMTYSYSHTGFNSHYYLSDFYPPKNLHFSLNLSYDYSLSHDSLIRIINNLSTVTTATTLKLGTSNYYKLTADEIAIATGKGWTVSV